MIGRTVDGARLQHLREEAGLRRPQLASLAGCSPGHLKHVETGLPAADPAQLSRLLARRVAAALTEALGRPVDMDEFMKPSERPEEKKSA